MAFDTVARKVWPDDYGGDNPNKETPVLGICCPKCGCKRTKVSYVRNKESGNRIRQRICANCGKSFRTYEHI